MHLEEENSPWPDIAQRLAHIQTEGLWRSLHMAPEGRDKNLISNDYLNVSTSDVLRGRLRQWLDTSKMPLGSGGSRLLGGQHPIFEQFEQTLARDFKSQSALLMGSGFMANLAVLSCLPTRQDTLLMDERVHASLREGARLSLAKVIKYRHLDLEDARKKWKKATGQVYWVTESIFSMSGKGHSPEEMADFVDETEVRLLLDEAHTTGLHAFGVHGFGASPALLGKCFVRIACFGKAYGGAGAALLTYPEVRDLCINTSRPFIYTTAMSPLQLAYLTFAHACIREETQRQTQLQERIHYFSERLGKGFEQHTHPIFYFPIPETEARLQALAASGFTVRAIRPPTVPADLTGIRICLHHEITYDSLNQLHRILT